jgi:hypothetical protein
MGRGRISVYMVVPVRGDEKSRGKLSIDAVWTIYYIEHDYDYHNHKMAGMNHT